MTRIDLVHTDPEAALKRLAQSRFRARFHLAGKTAAQALTRDAAVTAAHARALLAARIGTRPANDGRQTPMRGHPVFVAQHACALCCRGCMQKWYGIPVDRALTDTELSAAMRLVSAWIERERRAWRRHLDESTQQNGRRKDAREPNLFSR